MLIISIGIGLVINQLGRNDILIVPTISILEHGISLHMYQLILAQEYFVNLGVKYFVHSLFS